MNRGTKTMQCHDKCFENCHKNNLILMKLKKRSDAPEFGYYHPI